MQENFFKNKRITVTGGKGFLGSFVCDALKRAGASQISAPSSQDVDLVDSNATEAFLNREKPDLIFHLAARVGGIGANQKNPGKYFYENMQMGMNVFEAARKYGVQKTVFVGTICSYPKFAPIPFKEADLWNGYPEETNAPYGVAKKALMTMASAYKQQYGTTIISLMPVNLYGPRDNFDLESSHVIPAMIRKCIDAVGSGADEVVLWGDGSPTREFLYVEDCVEGLLRAAALYDSPDPVNLGAGFEIKMKDLVELIADLTGFKGKLHWDSSRPNGQPRRMLDTTKAHELFDFKAQTSLKEGLRKTITWYQDNKKAL
ncbi:MAG: GDP-L-fucose synthase [Myxococcales bacterium]|nr:MAG: GDP-L-fucose synthase [Myxococcales bacterium]